MGATMSLLALIAALALEQFKPLSPHNIVQQALARYAFRLERWFDAGETHHGVIAWILAVVPIVAGILIVYLVLYRLSPVFAWGWNVVVLYFTMGFRQFSHHFRVIAEALRAGEIESARAALAEWLDERTGELTGAEIARRAIEQGLLCSHRHVFGVIFWFLALPGPVGAVLYHQAWVIDRRWAQRKTGDGQFGRFARNAFEVLDWIPVRLTAVSFAIVGDFEDALYCWRAQAAGWLNRGEGILLASGGGALGVRLGEDLHRNGALHYRPELGMGDEADAAFMQSTVGLVWRALVLWLLVLLLLTVANWVG
jgi:adenosylcobinamide-phosphate synthase